MGRPQDFRGGETILHAAIMVDTCHYTLLQTTDHTAPRVSPNVNPVLQEIMTCQCDFSDYNECPTPGVLIVAEALRVRVCVWGGQGR